MHCTGKDATQVRVHTRKKIRQNQWQTAEGEGGPSTSEMQKTYAFSLQVDSCFLLTSQKKGKSQEVPGCTLKRMRGNKNRPENTLNI